MSSKNSIEKNDSDNGINDVSASQSDVIKEAQQDESKSKLKDNVLKLREHRATESQRSSLTVSNNEQVKSDKPVRRIKQVYLDREGSEEKKITSKVIRGDVNYEKAIEAQTQKALDSEHDDEWLDDYDTEIFNPEIHVERLISREEFLPHNVRKNTRISGLKIALIAVVLVFSICMSSVVGIALALWDTNKKISDLTGIVFGGVVHASTVDGSESSALIFTDEKTEDSSDLITTEENPEKAEASDEKQKEKAESKKTEKKAAQNKKHESEADLSTADAEINDQSKPEQKSVTEEDSVIEQIAGIESYVKASQEDELVHMDNDMVATAIYADPNANYPLSFSTVDESYFTDALFIGDSRMQGFGLWSGLPATFYCATGFQLYRIDTTKVVQTENGKVPIFDALPYDAFTKIYIKVGLNEMGWGNEGQFEELYASVIERLREREPRAIIYIHGLLPVTAEKSANHATHNNKNITARNESLKEFAVTQKAYFVDAGEALAGPDGCLPSEMTGDGVHLKSQYMPIWKDYLLQHAAVIR